MGHHPAKRKQSLTTVRERAIHIAVVKHLQARGRRGLVFLHCPNGEKRNGKTGAILKAMGVRPGVSDLLLFFEGKSYALELKAEGGRPTVEQMQFISDFNAAGGYGCIVEGLNRALSTLETWGLLRGQAQLRMVA